MTSDPINIKAFKKVFNNFVKENERGVRRQLRRGAVGSNSFNGIESKSLGNSPCRRTSFTHAITMEAYEKPEISPRNQLRLKQVGKSKKDFDEYVSLVSPRLSRRDSLNQTEKECEQNIDKQLNNLKSETSHKKVRKSSLKKGVRRDSF